MPDKSWWTNLTLCCQKTKEVVVNDVVPILRNLVTGAQTVLKALIESGVIKFDDDRAGEALRALDIALTGLNISGLAAQQLVKYIPTNLQDVGDLNQDGTVNAADMVELLQSGEKVLDQLIEGKLISTADATKWKDAFSKSIIVLSGAEDKKVNVTTMRRMIGSNGAIAIPPNTYKTHAQMSNDNEELQINNGNLTTKLDSTRKDIAAMHVVQKDLISALTRGMAPPSKAGMFSPPTSANRLPMRTAPMSGTPHSSHHASPSLHFVEAHM